MASPAPEQDSLSRVGIVAIGRNEGERLRRCLRSVPDGVAGAVYVDSGSSDGSTQFARSLGVEVVDLDMSRPFTAARARNAGFARLRDRFADVRYVQFVDGDCAIAPGWLSLAAAELDAQPTLSAVWGRRREAAPQTSVYNRVCDIEWAQVPPGETDTFGGDVMLRVADFLAVGGYDDGLIAGEDPELAIRMHKRGCRIVRLDAEMTLHDAAMTRLSQWWTRAVRAGHAFAEVSELHGEGPERFWVRERSRAMFWGLSLPLAVPVLAPPTLGLSTLALGLYPLRLVRIARDARRRGLDARDARAWALNCVGASFPQAYGVLKYRTQKLRGVKSTLIEYKEEP